MILSRRWLGVGAGVRPGLGVGRSRGWDWGWGCGWGLMGAGTWGVGWENGLGTGLRLYAEAGAEALGMWLRLESG